MKKTFTLFLLLLMALLPVAALEPYLAPSGGELAYRLISPVFLGGGLHVTRTGTPQAVFVNPAAGAAFQRTTLDANYTLMYGLKTASFNPASGTANAANVGMAIPSRVGVFSWGAGFMETVQFPQTAMDMGAFGRLHLAFSKQLYSDLWFGFSLTGSLGQLDNEFQGGGAFNAGFLHFPETAGKLNNFRWGGSLNGLGYRYGSSSRGYMNALPGNLTPAVGAAFDPVDRPKFRITLRSDLRIPSLTDFWAGLSSDFYFGQYARLSVSSSFAVRDAFAGSWQTVIPSVTLAAHVPLSPLEGEEAGSDTSEMDFQLAAAPLYAGVWAFSAGTTVPFGIKDENPPAVTTEFDSPMYFSPNYDGINDEILVPYTADDERFITSYIWEVKDENGNVVRRFVNKDERPENESFKNLGSRLFAAEKGTPLPAKFRWDGVSDTGAPAEDGAYKVYLTFADDNGNTSTSGPFPVILDTVAPELKMAQPEGTDLVFSPDGDGFKDSFVIMQQGSTEQLWEAAVIDASGREVRTYAWADSAVKKLTWDGLDDNGQIVADGVYRYVLSSTDQAGNSVEGSVYNIIVDTRQPQVNLSINRSKFSPGSAGTVNTITLKPEVSVKSGISEWVLEVLDMNGKTMRSWTYRESPVLPASVEYMGRRDQGGYLPEGLYRARLSLVYGNGFQPQVESPVFEVDTTAPKASASVNWKVFAPQSGSARSNVTIRQDVSREGSWQGILYSGKTPVKEWTWMENVPETLVWDGRGSDGQLVPDGEYTYVLRSTDEAGNTGQSKGVSVRVDTGAVEASVTSSLDIFAPGGSGTGSAVNLFLRANSDSQVGSWTLNVQDASENTLRSWSGNSDIPEKVEWDGRSESGRVVTDGFYTASLTVNYQKGLSASSRTGKIEVDTEAPVINVSVPDVLFSPDGDGSKDLLAVEQSSSAEEYFESYFVNAEGNKVRSYVWTEELKNFSWDGADNSGNILPDGTYSYIVSGVDKAGNRSEKRIKGVKIDTAPTPVYLTASEAFIRAGETDRSRMQSFAAVVPNESGIASWNFSIKKENNTVVWKENGTGRVPDTFRWNGTDTAGRLEEGVFTGYLTVNYQKGASPTAASRSFVVDGSPPVVSVNLEPQPFTPDDDNVDDEVVIGLAVQDSSRIAQWSLVINDPRGKEFISFSGKGRPSERIIWDGRSGQGELVESAEDYPYTLTVSDVLGQTTNATGTIGVGILVIREGDRLKIRLNNITFQPNSPSLTVDGEQGEKNREVLDRLAEIMKKFGSYRILVEGHAVSLKWENPAAARREQENILMPLSLSRAETVVNELKKRGIAANRMNAEGIGGARPIVPHGDVEQRWKNRRVEFFLEK